MIQIKSTKFICWAEKAENWGLMFLEFFFCQVDLIILISTLSIIISSSNAIHIVKNRPMIKYMVEREVHLLVMTCKSDVVPEGLWTYSFGDKHCCNCKTKKGKLCSVIIKGQARQDSSHLGPDISPLGTLTYNIPSMKMSTPHSSARCTTSRPGQEKGLCS